MVCWRETPDAARALGVVMPFLINAERVIVVSVAETNVDHTAEGIGAVSRYLLWNEVAVETEVIKTCGPTAELLASAAQGHQADLVVLGAFGHSQIRELRWSRSFEQNFRVVKWIVGRG